MSTWTPEQERQVRNLFREGLSYGRIAETVDRPKLQVVACLKRLKLYGRRHHLQPRHLRYSERTKPKPPAPMTEKEKPWSLQGRIWRVSDTIWRPRTCQYPFGDPKSENFHFCGRRLPIADGRPYCGEHYPLCTRPD